MKKLLLTVLTLSMWAVFAKAPKLVFFEITNKAADMVIASVGSDAKTKCAKEDCVAIGAMIDRAKEATLDVPANKDKVTITIIHTFRGETSKKSATILVKDLSSTKVKSFDDLGIATLKVLVRGDIKRPSIEVKNQDGRYLKTYDLK